MPNIEESKGLYELTVKELKDTIASAIDEKFAELDSKIENLTNLLVALSDKLEKDSLESESAESKSPISFTLCGHYHEENHWKILAVKLYEEIYKGNKDLFSKKVLKEIPPWFSDNPGKLSPSSKPKEISDSGTWGKTHIGEVHFRDIVEKFRNCFGYDETDLSVGAD